MNVGEYKPIKIMLLAGGDLVQSFAAPDVWATADVSHEDPGLLRYYRED